MAEEVIKTRGPTKASQPDAGGANLRETAVFAVVKDNIDPTRSGRLQVYITDFGGDDPDNKDNWISVSYMTPFYGATVPSGGNSNYGTYVDNPSSYGMWYSPPDIDSIVIVVFINGDPNYGFWIGCVPKAEALTMVPAIGATTNIIANTGEAKSYGGATRLPVTNINMNNKGIADSADYITAAKPVHSYQAGIMTQQGIIRDPVRGPISSSAQRETPSRVGWGVSTPGRPIYEGGYDDEGLAQSISQDSPPTDQSLKVIARRSGHSIVMDDGDLVGKDQLIRIRTSKGHQILMSDDGQTLMILHSNGQSYVELGKEGTVDVYSTNSINLRTQGDLNLHADRNINIHAAKEFNVQAESIKINAEKNIGVKSGTTTEFYSLGNYTVKSDASMSLESAGDSSFLSKSVTYVNGNKINLNTGASSTIPKEVAPIPITAHTDTLHDEDKGYAAAPGKLLSITSRAPAHAPWANAGQGVDVKVDLSASSNLPAAPSAGAGAANKVAATVPTSAQNPAVSVATAAVMPSTQAISAALDKNTTSAVLGAAATLAANTNNPLAKATTSGFAVATVNGAKQLGVGTFAQTAAQLVVGGILKPGADKIVNTLLNSTITNISSSTNISQVLPSSLFTGKSGAATATGFVNNLAAQATSQITNFQQAQTALTTGGLLKGTEAPGQVAGLVLSCATTGVSNTISAVNTAISNPNLQLNASSATAAFKAINSGEVAAGLAQNVTGGLGGISNALNALGATSRLGLGNLLDATKGVSGSAFNAITKQFIPLAANIPQDLKQIAKDNATKLDSLSTGTLPTPDGLAAKASSLASGLNNLPGGQKIVQGVVNKASGAAATLSNQLPGTAGIADAAKKSFDKIVNNAAINIPNIPTNPGGLLNSAISSGLSGAGLSAGAAAQLTSAISALSSGGKLPIKLPSIGFNTNVRSGVDNQIASVFGNPKIPKPTFNGEISAGAINAQGSLADAIKAQQKLVDDINVKSNECNGLLKAYYDAKYNNPQGSPLIDEALAKWQACAGQEKELRDKIKYQEDDPTRSG